MDRRALLIGHWSKFHGSGPSSRRVEGLMSRWEQILDHSGSYPFTSITKKSNAGKRLLNPQKSTLYKTLVDDPTGVTDDTLLLLYYLGHSLTSGENDLELYLNVSEEERKTIVLLSELIKLVEEGGFKKLILILDSCHVGHGEAVVRNAPIPHYTMLATGDSYAFDANFSESLIRTLERPPHRNDQRIDRKHQGFTYRTLFESTYANIMRRAEIREIPVQSPKAFGELGDEVLRPAPPIVPRGYSSLANDRTVYGRIFLCLNIISERSLSPNGLFHSIRQNTAFRIKKKNYDDEKDVFLSGDRIRTYLSFIRQCGFVAVEKGKLVLTQQGEKAADEGHYNRCLVDAIEQRVLPSGVTLELLNEIVHELLENLVPATPIQIQERAHMKRFSFPLTDELRMALLVLPMTGHFLKGTSDALYPSESMLE